MKRNNGIMRVGLGCFLFTALYIGAAGRGQEERKAVRSAQEEAKRKEDDAAMEGYAITQALAGQDPSLPIERTPGSSYPPIANIIGNYLEFIPVQAFGTEDNIRSLILSRNGTEVIVLTDDGRCTIRRVSDGKILGRIGDKNTYIDLIALDPQGDRLAIVARDQPMVVIINILSGKTVMKLQVHEKGINSVAFSADGAYIITAEKDKTVSIWDAKTGKKLNTLINSHEIRTATLNSDGSKVLARSAQRIVSIWDVKTGKKLWQITSLFDLTSEPPIELLSPDGTLVAITNSNNNDVRLYDATTGELVHTLHGHTALITGIAFSPDNALIATASLDKTARIWDARTGASLRVLRGHTQAINSITFSPDGTIIATTSNDGTARLWDAQTSVLIQILKNGYRTSYAQFDHRGDSLATLFEKKYVRIWAQPLRLQSTPAKQPQESSQEEKREVEEKRQGAFVREEQLEQLINSFKKLHARKEMQTLLSPENIALINRHITFLNKEKEVTQSVFNRLQADLTQLDQAMEHTTSLKNQLNSTLDHLLVAYATYLTDRQRLIIRRLQEDVKLFLNDTKQKELLQRIGSLEKRLENVVSIVNQLAVTIPEAARERVFDIINSRLDKNKAEKAIIQEINDMQF